MKRFTNLLLILSALFYLVSCVPPGMKILITNPTDLDRQSELIELDRTQLDKYLDTEKEIAVIERGTTQFLATQQIDMNSDGEWETLLIRVSLEAHESQQLIINNSSTRSGDQESKVFGRFVPERKDDFAWESDRIAFRVYGPALEATGEIGSGVDVWVKNVDYPIINKWYASDEYHVDHGEGADLYKVGPTLGCGGLGLLDGDTLFTSKNFSDYRILAQGPLRFVFELDYKSWGPDALIMNETKRITLDAGQQFNHMESQLKLHKNLTDSQKLITGLVSHCSPPSNPVTLDSSDDYIILYEAFKGDNGSLGTAIIRNSVEGGESLKKIGDQYLMVVPISDRGHVSYYAGAAWSKSPWIENEADWARLVKNFEIKLKQPIQITTMMNP